MPSLFDPHNRPAAPGAETLKPIRFLLADDYPPFEFLGPDGTLAGFNVDLARAICHELKVSCTVQPRRWDNLLDALDAKEGDAVIASLKETPAARAHARFTAPYYLTPARFMSLATAKKFDVRPEALRDVTIGVEAGSAHQAFLKLFFARSTIKTFPDRAALLAALRDKKIDLAFGDAVTYAIWMNDPHSDNCCVFQGGPFLEPAFFGEGIGVAVRPGDDKLRHTLDWALQQLDESGKLNELYLKYFPIGFY
ncbi:transporter substrate-binding domain-containing protein [Rhodoblastus acidophilus]|uniref:Transporter substrate-binding domain-containing protein n=1 Tax=Candidatus Rhodoblastus alkanivorans TaxID=2954117 RepID=A0ABS9ZAW0_9HYPH|nr:transporter substrate-binding domain-containing protein [Candidatus Rhodoblastus alkanivorans]MCI4677208.1 transporter substrate-binding domain-containing protein [Candidatus Rhodoblastus alkanivorans]MCI4684561.1 transporter substrate-binding domain-containing protein [Candidatus Rhodoblastus alkanivorans]MDI4641882.1 transporter substrate-binding domain-containing protein [Rhodoblastus acidophilus]